MTALIFVGSGVLMLLAYVWWSSASIKTAERERGDAQVNAKDLEGQLSTMTANYKAEKTRADYQEKRANALDHELDAVADSGDPTAARGRVLSRLSATEATDPAARGGGAGLMPRSGPNPKVEIHDDTALENPSA